SAGGYEATGGVPAGAPREPENLWNPWNPWNLWNLLSGLLQRAHFRDDLDGHVDHQVVSARQALAADLRSAFLPDREHVVETAHRPALAPQRRQRARDLLVEIRLVVLQIDRRRRTVVLAHRVDVLHRRRRPQPLDLNRVGRARLRSL